MDGVAKHNPGSRSRAFRFALKASLLYLAFGVTWILLSDRLVDVAFDGHLENLLGTIKGIVFMLLSGGAIFFAIRGYGQLSEKTEAEIRASGERLRHSEDRYRSLVERVPGIVYLHHAKVAPSSFTYISPQVADYFGYPTSAWTDDPRFWLTLVHPEDVERVRRADTAAIENGADLDIEYRIRAADGKEVWIQDHASVIADASGDPLFRQGLMVDVTDRRRAEEDRRRALDRQLRLASRLELLHRVDRALLSASSIEQIAETALDHLRLLVPFDRATMMLIDEATGVGTELVVRHSPEFGSTSAIPPEGALSPAALESLSHDVLSVPDLDAVEVESPELVRAREQGIRSSVAMALRSEGRQIGALVVSSMRPGAFDEEAIDILTEVASEIAIAVSQTLLRDAAAERAKELERVAKERQQMLRRIVRAQEEERQRVGLEIHDGLGQVLTSISLFASDLEDEVPPASRKRVARVNELIRRAITDSRQLVWSLRPPELERLGLVPALRRLSEVASTEELTVDLHEKIGGLRLTQEAEAVVYRVVQEALHNAQKHASASAISILLRRRDGYLSTIVEDNGCGFDAAAVPLGGGMGLIGMRERAELVEGHLVVESADQAGTRVRLEVPVDAPERGSHG